MTFSNSVNLKDICLVKTETAEIAKIATLLIEKDVKLSLLTELSNLRLSDCDHGVERLFEEV